MAAIHLNKLIIDLTDEVNEYAPYDDSATLEPLHSGNYDLDMVIGNSECTIRTTLDISILMMSAIANELGFKVVPIVTANNEHEAAHCSEYFDEAGNYHKKAPIERTTTIKSNASVKHNAYVASTSNSNHASHDEGKLISFTGNSTSDTPDSYEHALHNTKTEKLGLSLRVETLLLSYGLKTLLDIVRCSGNHLLMRDQFGRASLDEVIRMLHSRGLRLSMSYQDIRQFVNKDKAGKL